MTKIRPEVADREARFGQIASATPHAPLCRIELTSRTGQGLGLRWQNSSMSYAQSAGTEI
ncbi:hypothetical protein AB0C88_23450 [Streptomyces chartreusis]|uniref:hypothetical protein n=1 Tax=Streptomyces chartreusis TaxID=1969 RepID=UPI0033D93AFE